MTERYSLFCDGGCIRKNPSPIGGSWAFVVVDSEGCLLREHSGVIDAKLLGVGGYCTNNVSELYALCYGILDLPAVWWTDAIVDIYSDSECTLGRIFLHQSLNGVPPWLVTMVRNVREHLKKLRFTYTLVAGHPNRAELELGKTIERRNKQGKITQIGGVPVSKWNCFCDSLCTAAGEVYLAQMEEARS